MFLTPPQFSQSSTDDPDAGEGTSTTVIVAFRDSPSSPAECLSQMKSRQKQAQDGVFQEMLQVCAASGNETRAWRMTLADSMKERVERRKAREKERERCTRT
ncbi:hypothetical protein KIL84_018084 [Mauremys mutica]|uniref:Uncharacterized protein n=1 Tax=Mauremys mutica TaxID=74926 RepID=A0A9D3XUA1_9SAUR|nr:hypothetical protein KIL84_018084 [Mauremys mutica]